MFLRIYVKNRAVGINIMKKGLPVFKYFILNWVFISNLNDQTWISHLLFWGTACWFQGSRLLSFSVFVELWVAHFLHSSLSISGTRHWLLLTPGFVGSWNQHEPHFKNHSAWTIENSFAFLLPTKHHYCRFHW